MELRRLCWVSIGGFERETDAAAAFDEVASFARVRWDLFFREMLC